MVVSAAGKETFNFPPLRALGFIISFTSLGSPLEVLLCFDALPSYFFYPLAALWLSGRPWRIGLGGPDSSS